MMMTWGSRPTPASSSEVPALLDRLEIWDTPVTHRSRSRPPRTYQDGVTALRITLCVGAQRRSLLSFSSEMSSNRRCSEPRRSMRSRE